MRVRQGWSGETAPNQWNKFDVTTDETDLARILARGGLPEDIKVTTKTAYVLLATEAEILLTTARMRYSSLSAEQAHLDIQPLVQLRESHLEMLRVTG